MNRRQLLAGSASLLLGAAGVRAAGVGHVNYSRTDFDAALASGKSVLLDFYAPW